MPEVLASEAGSGAIVLGAGIDAVEDEDFGLRAKRLAQRDALHRMRDEEGPATHLAQR